MCPDRTLTPKRPNPAAVATWVGFILLVAGVSRLSATAAMIVAGALLFVAGGMAARERQP